MVGIPLGDGVIGQLFFWEWMRLDEIPSGVGEIGQNSGGIRWEQPEFLWERIGLVGFPPGVGGID